MWTTAGRSALALFTPRDAFERIYTAFAGLSTLVAVLVWITPSPATPTPGGNLTPYAMAAEHYTARPSATPRAPRISHAMACVYPCEAVYPPEPFAPRSVPLDFLDLARALDAAGWPFGWERDFLVRMISTCENRELDAGAISYTGEAFGIAQVTLAWFDAAGIPRELWPSPTWNLRAARAARDDAVARGLHPFVYWSCRYAGAAPG